MRAIRCILGFSFFLAVLLESARGKSCLSHSECREDECCMTKSAYLGGCRSRAREGGSCLPEISKSNIGDMFMMSCPCLDNLVCVPAAIVENKEDRTVQYLNSTCQTAEALLNLYKRLLKSDVHPKLLISVLKNIIG